MIHCRECRAFGRADKWVCDCDGYTWSQLRITPWGEHWACVPCGAMVCQTRRDRRARGIRYVNTQRRPTNQKEPTS